MNARKYLQQSLDAREHQHDFLASLKWNDQALQLFDTDNDTEGFTEGIANRAITLKLYAFVHKSRRFLHIAEGELRAAVVLTQESNNESARMLPLYQRAQIQELLGDLSAAVASYQEAIAIMKNNPPKKHDRLELLHTMTIHLATAQYKNGNKNALHQAEKALKELSMIENHNTYEQAVWLSGGHMKIAESVAADDLHTAKEHMHKAKEIIDAHPSLGLRKKQWDELNAVIAKK